jgi:hypothetical protein
MSTKTEVPESDPNHPLMRMNRVSKLRNHLELYHKFCEIRRNISNAVVQGESINN